MRHQQGSALIFSLLILLVMTLIGVTAMNTSTLEEKMAANDRNQKIAFQVAESGLSEAETAVENADGTRSGLLAKFDASATYDGYTDMSPTFDPYAETWTVADGSSTGNCVAGTAVSGSTNAPCYMVESMDINTPMESQGYGQPIFATHISRITTRAQDTTATGTVILQSTFSKELVP